ncbi:acyltransferase [Paenibacillus psychroresistens]|uniref:Acyltransferase n=1 Tax=Paenibacillus psychroresistens TaxID=1778678 RepID=A0A6B8RFX4_9BACL|nr:acyltransferase [Paenibacillus psychroresistens]QGQ94423.1 acyltransferase [Paenibacillus psychroresistens]
MNRDIDYLNPLWNFFVNIFGGSYLLHNRFRKIVYKIFGLKIDECVLRPKIFFYSNKVNIGNGSFINKGCYFYNTGGINIGENVYIGPEVMFCTASHKIGESHQRCGEFESKPIYIGDGTWIGARANIMPGVRVEKGCVIAAGAVVTSDCEQDGLYAGVPAKRIKNLNEPIWRGVSVK